MEMANVQLGCPRAKNICYKMLNEHHIEELFGEIYSVCAFSPLCKASLDMKCAANFVDVGKILTYTESWFVQLEWPPPNLGLSTAPKKQTFLSF